MNIKSAKLNKRKKQITFTFSVKDFHPENFSSTTVTLTDKQFDRCKSLKSTDLNTYCQRNIVKYLH